MNKTEELEILNNLKDEVESCRKEGTNLWIKKWKSFIFKKHKFPNEAHINYICVLFNELEIFTKMSRKKCANQHSAIQKAHQQIGKIKLYVSVFSNLSINNK